MSLAYRYEVMTRCPICKLSGVAYIDREDGRVECEACHAVFDAPEPIPFWVKTSPVIVSTVIVGLLLALIVCGLAGAGR